MSWARGEETVVRASVLDNNGLHQTGRGGVAFAARRRPVVESRPAGEPGCSTLHRVGHCLRGSWSSGPRGLVEVTRETPHLCGAGGAPISQGTRLDSRHSERLGQDMHRVRVVPLPIGRGRSLWAQPAVLVCGSAHQGLPMPVNWASGSAVACSHREPDRTAPQTTGCRTIG